MFMYVLPVVLYSSPQKSADTFPCAVGDVNMYYAVLPFSELRTQNIVMSGQCVLKLLTAMWVVCPCTMLDDSHARVQIEM